MLSLPMTGTAIEYVVARRAGDAVAAQAADHVLERDQHILDRGRGGATLRRPRRQRDEQGIRLADVGDGIVTGTAGQGVDAQSTNEHVVAGATRERVIKAIADQRIGPSATGDVLDAGDGGEARGAVGRQVDGHGRGRAGAVAQRIAAAQEVGRDDLDTGERAAGDPGQGRAVEDDGQGVGGRRTGDGERIQPEITDHRVGPISNRVENEIVAGAGIDDVIARAAGDGVIAAKAGQAIGPGKPTDDVLLVVGSG